MLKLKNNLGMLMIFYIFFMYFICYYYYVVFIAIFHFNHLIMDYIMLNIFVIASVFIIHLNHHHYNILDYS